MKFSPRVQCCSHMLPLLWETWRSRKKQEEYHSKQTNYRLSIIKYTYLPVSVSLSLTCFIINSFSFYSFTSMHIALSFSLFTFILSFPFRGSQHCVCERERDSTRVSQHERVHLTTINNENLPYQICSIHNPAVERQNIILNRITQKIEVKTNRSTTKFR